MTKDEQRAACIEVMAVAMFDCYRGYNDEIQKMIQKMMWEREKGSLRRKAERALDALATAGVYVNPIEATEEMINASYEKERDLLGPTACGLKHSVIFETMSAAGNLINPPEAKP
jgi:hypothetical protein